MTEDLTEVLRQSPSFPDLAKSTFDMIVAVKGDIEKRFIDLACLLVQCRDYRLWEFLNYDTFESFLGDPQIGVGRSTAFDLMHVYDLYVVKLNVAQEDLARAGKTKLLTAAKIVEKDPATVIEWVDKAGELSNSDLTIEVDAALGRVPKSLSPPKKSPPSPGPLDSVCCVCGNGPVDRHHFPVGRSSSSDEVGDWTIPLCRECHSEFHRGPADWTWKYRKNWARYLFRKIDELKKA